MKNFLRSIRPSIFSLIILTLLLGFVYPIVVWGIGQVFFKNKANGTLFYYQNGQVIGSDLIAQPFSKPEYFHPRASYAGNGYDASNSSGSNLGPTSQKLIDAVSQRIAAYRSENNLSSKVLLPADAVTASASGLDPHISVENALLQLNRVASARGFSEKKVQQLINEYTEMPTLGIFGEKRINVLRINLALDKLTASKG